MTGQRVWISCVVILIVICLCLSMVAVVVAGYLALQAQPESSAVTPTALPDQSGDEIGRQMDEIQQQVIAIRGLQPTGPVERSLLTPEELRQHVQDDFLADYSAEEAADDALILNALGLLEADFDLYAFYEELYTEQVAGYYDNEAKAMYVIRGSGFWGPERLTYAHEYEHVLQDQIYDIEDGLGYNEDACEADSERCAAISSLLEGDASLVEYSWFAQYATETDAQQIRDFYSTYESPIYDSAPEFMREDFIFPYTYGQTFVESLYNDGGWEAVDRAFRNVPVSTEQILHPERYPADVPLVVSLPDLLPVLGEGWRELDRNVTGEWYTYLILAYGIEDAARVGRSQAEQAAEGWGGDAYLVCYNDEQDALALVIDWVWDTPVDAQEFAEAFRAYGDGRFGAATASANGVTTWSGADFAAFYVNGARTTWILAPDAGLAQQIWDAIAAP